MRFARGRRGNAETGIKITGIAGAGGGTGVTHLSLMLANYLQGVCRKRTAVLECNDHGDFSRFGEACTGQTGPRTCYGIQQVDYYPGAAAGRLMECQKAEYEHVVIDFGIVKEMTCVELMRCSTVWILMSFSEWQMEAFWELMRSEGFSLKESWQFFTVFGSEESRTEWNKRRKPKITRVPLSADAFSVTRELMDWMETVTDHGSFPGSVSRRSLLKGKEKSFH